MVSYYHRIMSLLRHRIVLLRYCTICTHTKERHIHIHTCNQLCENTHTRTDMCTHNRPHVRTHTYIQVCTYGIRRAIRPSATCVLDRNLAGPPAKCVLEHVLFDLVVWGWMGIICFLT